MQIRKNLTLKEKMEILDSVNQKISIKVLCTKYNVHKSTITRIIKNKDKICEFVKQTVIPVKNVKRIIAASVPETETALYTWFLNERVNHNLVSDKSLQLKALEFHKELNGNIKFEASHGWVQKFKKRHSIRLLKVCGEKLSCNDSAVPLFIENFMKILHDQNFVADQIYNADESGLVYKFLSTNTLVSCDESCAPGRKFSKERITIMPCTNANGKHKLPLMIIGKSKNPRCFKNVTFPPMHYRSSKNAWQTRTLFHEWFSEIFLPEVRQYLISKNLPPKAVLLLDNATAHCSNEKLISEDGNITVYFFPPNTTAILQPLDQGIIKTIKQIYRKKLLYNLISKPGDNLHVKLGEINLKEVIFLITDAWTAVSESVISNGFKRIVAPQTYLSIEESDISLPHLYRQVVPLTNLTDGEILHWASGVEEKSGNLITEEDIINDYQEDNNDDNMCKPGINFNEVLDSLNITIDYAESNLAIEDILCLRKIREKVICNSIKIINCLDLFIMYIVL